MIYLEAFYIGTRTFFNDKERSDNFQVAFKHDIVYTCFSHFAPSARRAIKSLKQPWEKYLDTRVNQTQKITRKNKNYAWRLSATPPPSRKTSGFFDWWTSMFWRLVARWFLTVLLSMWSKVPGGTGTMQHVHVEIARTCLGIKAFKSVVRPCDLCSLPETCPRMHYCLGPEWGDSGFSVLLL